MRKSCNLLLYFSQASLCSLTIKIICLFPGAFHWALDLASWRHKEDAPLSSVRGKLRQWGFLPGPHSHEISSPYRVCGEEHDSYAVYVAAGAAVPCPWSCRAENWVAAESGWNCSFLPPGNAPVSGCAGMLFNPFFRPLQYSLQDIGCIQQYSKRGRALPLRWAFSVFAGQTLSEQLLCVHTDRHPC